MSKMLSVACMYGLSVLFFVANVRGMTNVCLTIGNGEFCNVAVVDPTDMDMVTTEAIRNCHTFRNTIDHFDVEILKNHLSAWMKIREFRRSEFRTLLRIKRKQGRLVQFEVDFICSNDLEPASTGSNWLRFGSNILDGMNANDMRVQLNEEKIDSISIPTSAWSRLLGGGSLLETLVHNLQQYIALGCSIYFFIDTTATNLEFSELSKRLSMLEHHSTQISLQSSKQISVSTEQKSPFFIGTQSLCVSSKFCVSKTYVVNLERRMARYENFKKYAAKNLSLQENIDYYRFNAIDGKNVKMTSHMKHLFRLDDPSAPAPKHPYRDHGFVPGVLGCALSNIHIWQELAGRDDLADNDAYLILEDDIWFGDNFLDRWKTTWQSIVHDSRWKWIYLGYSTDLDLYGDKFVHENVKEFSHTPRSIGGGTFGYAIRKSAAKMLLASLYRDGVQSAIDWFMIGHAQHVKGIYKCSPLLIMTTSVMHETSDTTQIYPEQLVVDQATRALNEQINRECVNSTFSKPSIEFSSKFSLEIKAPTVIESGRPILIEPSLVLKDGYDSSHFFQDMGCASICGTIVPAEDDSPTTRDAAKICHAVRQASVMKLTGVSPGHRKLQIWMEQQGITIGKPSKLYEISALPGVTVEIIEPSKNMSSVLPSFTMRFSYIVVDENNVNPSLWRMCLSLSSPWYRGLRSLGCQPIQTDITFSNLPYGQQSLHIVVKGFLDIDTLYEGTFSFIVVPFLDLPGPSLEWNKQTETCKVVEKRIMHAEQHKTNRSLFSLNVTLAVLTYRQNKSLLESMKSWKNNGLFAVAEERIIFFQNCASCEHEGRAPPTFDSLLQEANFSVIGSSENVGISRALAALVRKATSKHIIFLEEDWQLLGGLNLDLELTSAVNMLDKELVSLVKLRSSVSPGAPYCSSLWRNFEHLMIGSREDGELSILNAASWQPTDDQVKKYFGDGVWRCHSRFLCTTSNYCGWTNNPTMFTKVWFMQHMHRAAMLATHYESAINLSPPLWQERCFQIAQGKGLFSHVDLDKSLEEQSPCEVPRLVQENYDKQRKATS